MLKCIDPPISLFVILFILISVFATASNSYLKKVKNM